MTVLWEDVWDVLNQQFTEVHARLSQCNPTLWWSCGHSDNETFPFRAYASFGHEGVAGDADIVITVDFKRIPSGLDFSADISRENGEILVDGPRGSIVVTGDLSRLREDIKKATELMADFFASQDAILREIVCGQSPRRSEKA
ncbi:hypothetical protein [Kribbella swartbergensis]